MCPTVQVATQDSMFGDIVSSKLSGLGLSVIRRDDYLLLPPSSFLEAKVDVLVLDIRQQGGRTLNWLATLKEMVTDLEVLLINKPGEVGAAMEGMRIGAADELIAPFDTETLKNKVLAAVGRREKRKRGKGGFRRMFQNAMSAATFAQAGEFDTALDFITADRQENGSGKGK